VWAVIQGQIMQDIENGKKDSKLWIEDWTLNLWISWSINHQISQKLKWSIYFWYWWDIWGENIRTWEKIKLFEKKSVDVWLEYTKDDWNIISWKVNYEKWLWYNKKWWNISVKSWDTTLKAWFEKTDNSENPFLLDQAKKSIWLQYDISDTLNINLWYEDINNWSSRDKKTNFWINYTF
jgi:hypothetical protein